MLGFAFTATGLHWGTAAAAVVLLISLAGVITSTVTFENVKDERLGALNEEYGLSLNREDLDELEWPATDPEGMRVYGSAQVATVVDDKVRTSTATLVFDGHGFVLVDADGDEMPAK